MLPQLVNTVLCDSCFPSWSGPPLSSVGMLSNVPKRRRLSAVDTVGSYEITCTMVDGTAASAPDA